MGCTHNSLTDVVNKAPLAGTTANTVPPATRNNNALHNRHQVNHPGCQGRQHPERPSIPERKPKTCSRSSNRNRWASSRLFYPLVRLGLSGVGHTAYQSSKNILFSFKVVADDQLTTDSTYKCLKWTFEEKNVEKKRRTLASAALAHQLAHAHHHYYLNFKFILLFFTF